MEKYLQEKAYVERGIKSVWSIPGTSNVLGAGIKTNLIEDPGVLSAIKIIKVNNLNYH